MYVNHGFDDAGESIDQDRFQSMLDYAEAKQPSCSGGLLRKRKSPASIMLG